MAGFGHLGITGGKTWVNEGTLTIGSDDRILFGWPTAGAGHFVNAAGATVILASTYVNPFDVNSSGAHTFVNEGTLRQTAAGAHAVQNGIAFINTGTVNVETGTFTVGGTGTGTDTGTYSIASGATLNFSGGSRTLAETTVVSGPGTVQVTGAGTVNVSGLGVTAPILVGNGTLNFNATSDVVLTSVTLAGGTLAGTANVTVTGAVDITGSSSVLAGTGGFTTKGLTTVDMPGFGAHLGVNAGKTWINEGTLRIAGDDRILMGWPSGGTNRLVNTGTIELASTYSEPLGAQGGINTIDNQGTIRQTVAGAHTIGQSMVFNNLGSVLVEAGTLSVNGSGSADTGTYSVATGATLNFGAGTRTLLDGSRIDGTGSLSVSSATVTINGALAIAATGAGLAVTNGSLTVNGTAVGGNVAPVTVGAGGTLSFNTSAAITLPSLTLIGGTLAGTANVTVTGAVDITGSSSVLAGTGGFTTKGLTTVDMPGFGAHLGVNAGKTWINEGTLRIAGDDRILMGWPSGGTNRLVNTGTIELASTYSEPLGAQGGINTIDNQGTIRQTVAGAHTIGQSMVFNNLGSVLVEAGTLSVNGSGSADTGTYSVATGATLNFGAGTRTLLDGSRIDGTGSLSVSSATVTINGALAIAATGAGLAVTNGSLTVNGTAVGGNVAPVTVGAGGTLSFNTSAAITLPSLTLIGGTLAGTANVTVTGAVDITGSSSVLAGTGGFTTKGLTTVDMPGFGAHLGVNAGKTWINEGTLRIAGDDRILMGWPSGGTNRLVNTGTIELASTLFRAAWRSGRDQHDRQPGDDPTDRRPVRTRSPSRSSSSTPAPSTSPPAPSPTTPRSPTRGRSTSRPARA